MAKGWWHGFYFGGRKRMIVFYPDVLYETLLFWLDWTSSVAKLDRQRGKRGRRRKENKSTPSTDNNNPNTHFTYETRSTLWFRERKRQELTNDGWLDSLRETAKKRKRRKDKQDKKNIQKGQICNRSMIFFIRLIKWTVISPRQPATGLLFSSFLACCGWIGKMDNVEEGEKGCGLLHRSRNGIQFSWLLYPAMCIIWLKWHVHDGMTTWSWCVWLAPLETVAWAEADVTAMLCCFRIDNSNADSPNELNAFTMANTLLPFSRYHSGARYFAHFIPCLCPPQVLGCRCEVHPSPRSCADKIAPLAHAVKCPLLLAL